MPINSSSIPALRIARNLRRKKRAEGGAVFPEDIKRVHIRSDAPAGADESAMAGRTSTVPSWGMTSAFGTLSPGEEAMSTQELGDSQSSNFISKAGSVIGGIAKGLFYDFPKNMIDRSVQNPQPGLRREDFTDIPPDTSPDPKSAFGGIGVDVPRVGWQPVDPMVGSSLEAAGNMAGVSAPFIQKNALGIFGGRLAQTADHAALARAEKMSLEGVAPEVIWKDTGWFKGADDKWRFEIDDSASGYKRIYGKGTIDNYPISTPHTVETGAAYQHPDLYAAYPDLEKVPLQFRDLDGARGQYSHNPSSPGDLIPPHEAISLQTPVDRYGANMKQARSTTLHELQHAVQTREGFVPGGSPAEMQELVRATSDARVLRGQMELGSSVEEAAAAFAKAAGRPPHPAATKIAQELPPEDLSRIADNPHEAYRRLSGEVEARNVQTRQDLPDVARANIFPRSTEDVLPDLQTLGRGRPGRATDMSEIDGLLGAERKLAGVSDGRPPTAAAGPAAAPDPAAMGPGGGGTAGVRSLPEAQAAAARWAGERAPLEGLPGPLKIGEDFFVPGPIGKIHDVAEDFMRTVHPDRPYTPPTKYHPIDPEHSQAIAKAYEEMKHTPSDPATKASYDALIDETAKQYDAIKKTGLKIEPVPAGSPDPYAANPRLAAVDVAENNHLWFFPTESGFGTVNKITDNPMLRKTGEEAVKRYQKFNTTTAMASPGSDVMTEIQRGTAAHWLQNQGRFDDFKKFAGVPEEFRSRTAHFPSDMRYIGGHPYHRTSQSDPMQKYFDAGSIQSKEPKVPLYAHASGTPETGFQTTGPVGDAHFSRGVGLSDTRKGPTDVQGSFSRAEYQTLQPWWQHDVAGKVGLESVPGQARLWTALGPQTGVDSALGAPKLELLAQQIMVAAKRLRISPERARDLILSGEAGAGMLGGAIAAPVVSGAMRDRERAAGGGVDAAMEIARSIKRAKGGRVHVGPIVGDTGGRADKRPMEVPDGSYVLTADHVSGLGEGNTEAGMKKLGPMFPNSKPSKLRGLKGKAVPIYAADGEFVIHPDDIIDRFGELDYGHRSLDAWQTAERKQLIKTLKNLAPPAQD